MRLDAGYHRGITGDQEIALRELDTMGLPDPRWMSLIKALRHIKSVLSVSSISAQVALKKKIGRAELPVKWATLVDPETLRAFKSWRSHSLLLNTWTCSR